MNELLKELDSLSINFSQSGVQTMNIGLAFIMFGVALGIKLDTFKQLLKNPKSLAVGLLLQWVALPALTFVLLLVFHQYLSPMVALGMILVASCPGGNVSNFMSSFAKGNTELSVSMTAISTIGSALITPLNFSLWAGMYSRILERRSVEVIPELEIAFMPLFEQVFILLGIPIILGMLCARYCPDLTKRLIKPLQALSLLFFVILVGAAFQANFDLFTQYIAPIFVIVLVHNLLALAIGFWGARIFGLPVKDQRTLCIEVGIQNSGLGLVLLFNPSIFPAEGCGGMVFVTAWWGVWHIISGLTVSSLFRNYGSKN